MAHYSYEIGANAGARVNVETLVGVPPVSEHHEYSVYYDDSTGQEKGDGFPSCLWHFNFMPRAGMTALLALITGQSTIVSIKTRLNTDAYQAYATAIMHRPKVPSEAVRTYGGWTNVQIRFTMLEV